MRNTFYFLSLMFITLACGTPTVSEDPLPQEWRVAETPSKSSLRGLSPLTEEIAWVSGSEGQWMLTLDGGRTWNHGIIAGMDSVDFRDIEGMSASTAIAISAGQPAVIYKTTDGGETWVRTYEGQDSDFFNGMAWRDDKVGYAYGDPQGDKWVILKTTDGGDSWKKMDNPPKASSGEAGFAASGSVLVVDQEDLFLASGGTSSNVYFRKEGNNQWGMAATPVLQGEPSQGIFSMTMVDNRNLVAVGGDYTEPYQEEGNVVLSHDGGITWVKNEGNPPSGYRSGVAYFPRFHWVVAVGPTGSDFSKNGGEDWRKFSDIGFHAVKRSKSGGSIWASGSDGRVGILAYQE